jgi:hypothetical protein
MIRKIRDVLFIWYWSLRGQEWEAVALTMYRRARREGLTHEDASSLAEAYVRAERERTGR